MKLSPLKVMYQFFGLWATHAQVKKLFDDKYHRENIHLQVVKFERVQKA